MIQDLFISGQGHFTIFEMCDQFAFRHPGAWMIILIYLIVLNILKGLFDAITSTEEAYDSVFEKGWRIFLKTLGYQFGIRAKKK